MDVPAPRDSDTRLMNESASAGWTSDSVPSRALTSAAQLGQRLRIGIEGAGNDAAVRLGQAFQDRRHLQPGTARHRRRAIEGKRSGQHLMVDEGQAVLIAGAADLGLEQLRAA